VKRAAVNNLAAFAFCIRHAAIRIQHSSFGPALVTTRAIGATGSVKSFLIGATRDLFDSLPRTSL
jgi:hypothetical protein